MTRVQQCLLVVCVSAFTLISNIAFATGIDRVQENLQATVLVTTKKINAQVDETTGNIPPIPTPSPDGRGMGSGIIISKNGHIITNFHVIESVVNKPYGQISVWTYEEQSTKEYVAKIVGYDKLSDIAVLKIELKDTFVYDKIIWGKEPNFGDTIYSIGHPQGMVWSLSRGIVSNPKRYVTSPWQRLIQSDTLIMPGNSGGPLFNEDGELVGINTLLIFSIDPTVKTQAWAMSIHIDDVKWVVDRILQYGNTRRPAMNIEVDQDEEKKVKIRPDENTELFELGFREGYLLSVDGKEISDISDLFDYLKTKIDGDIAKIKVEEIPSGNVKEYSFTLMRWDEVIEKKEEQPKEDPNIKIIPAPDLHGNN